MKITRRLKADILGLLDTLTAQAEAEDLDRPYVCVCYDPEASGLTLHGPYPSAGEALAAAQVFEADLNVDGDGLPYRVGVAPLLPPIRPRHIRGEGE